MFNSYFNSKKEHRLHSPRKVVFSEPYEIVPNYMINNDFKKGNCDYVPKQNPNKPAPSFNMPFLPFFSSLLTGGMGNIGNMLGGMLNSGGTGSPMSSILSNPEFLTNISKLFFKSQATNNKKHEHKTEDIDIEQYTKVE